MYLCERFFDTDTTQYIIPFGNNLGTRQKDNRLPDTRKAIKVPRAGFYKSKIIKIHKIENNQ